MEGFRHVSSVENVENLRSFIKEDLRKEGIKPPKGKKAKKLNNSRGPSQDGMLVASGIFGNYLAHVPCEFVNDCGYVPKFLVDAAVHIRAHVKTEGIFRKSGSVSRQKELKLQIEEGDCMEVSSIYDLTTLIKQFFRELPEPLFTSLYHDCFIKCYQLEKAELVSKCIFSLCLLLPAEHLSTLRFIMQLFFYVASHSEDNKMDAANLSVVLAPNIMHVNSKSEKMNSTEEKLLQIQTAVVELLIKKAECVGMVSEELCKKAAMMTECFGNCTDDELDASDDNMLEDSQDMKKKKKKRKRSGSFQGIVNSIASGLAKLRRSTDGKSINSSQNATTASNESAQSLSGSLEQTQYPTTTPVVIRKRKASGEVIPFSASKKKAILQHLPQGSALGHTPFTPASAMRKMDDPRRGMVGDTPSMGDRHQPHFTVTPSHNIKTPRKKLNLFSPSSTKKKMARSPSFSNISTGSNKKRKNIFRRLSGSKADKSTASDSSLHVGERLASPPSNSQSMDTTGLRRSQSESDSPIAALAQNISCPADASSIAPSDIKQTLNEGFIGEFQVDLDQTDAGSGLQRSHSLYRPAVHASASDPGMAGAHHEGGNHKRSHSAELMALRRGQPNTINNGLLKGKHSELKKLRKSFDKSDISGPMPLLAPPVLNGSKGCPRSESEMSLDQQSHQGPPVPPPDLAPNPNSSLMNVILPPPTGFNDTIQQTGYDSDESEAGFSTISGDTVIYVPKQSSSSSSLCSNKSQKSRTEKGKISTHNSRENMKRLQSSDSSDSLLSSASEVSISSNKSKLERCLSTDSGKGSLFDETLVQPPNPEPKDSLDVAFVADESMLMDTTVLQKSCNESVTMDTSSLSEKSQCRQPSVKKSHSAQQLAHTPKIGVTRSQSMYSHHEARRHNIKPNLLISAETHKILSRAGYYSDQAPQQRGQDFRLPVKSPPRLHSFNISRRNTSLCDSSSLDETRLCNKSASEKLDLLRRSTHDASRSSRLQDTSIPENPITSEDSVCLKTKDTVTKEAKLLQIKRAETVLPKHESVSEIQFNNAGKVAENVKQFTKVVEQQNLPASNSNIPTVQRGMSPVRIPTIFAKNNETSSRYRDIAKAALERGRSTSEDNSSPRDMETSPSDSEVFKRPSMINSNKNITVTTEVSITVDGEASMEVDTSKAITFEGQNVDLSCSLLETINDVCTPKMQRKISSGNRSPLKDRGNNIGCVSPKSVHISEHIVLRTANGMTPRQVLKFAQVSPSKKRRSMPGPTTSLQKSRSPNKLSSISLPDDSVQSM